MDLTAMLTINSLLFFVVTHLSLDKPRTDQGQKHYLKTKLFKAIKSTAYSIEIHVRCRICWRYLRIPDYIYSNYRIKMNFKTLIELKTCCLHKCKSTVNCQGKVIHFAKFLPWKSNKRQEQPRSSC